MAITDYTSSFNSKIFALNDLQLDHLEDEKAVATLVIFKVSTDTIAFLSFMGYIIFPFHQYE